MPSVGRLQAVSAWCLKPYVPVERQFFIENLLVRIHFIIVMIRWTGLAPWDFEFPLSGSLTSTFLSEGNLTLDIAASEMHLTDASN